MRRQPGHNTRPHARLAPSFLGKDAWMTSQLNVVFHRKLRRLLLCLAYFLTCYSWVFQKTGIGRRPVDWCRNLMSVLYMGRSCALYRLLFFVPCLNIFLLTQNREEVRNLQEIPGSCPGDAMATLCCGCCSLVQVSAEVEFMRSRDAQPVQDATEAGAMATVVYTEEIYRK